MIQEEKRLQMTSQPVERLILRLAAPTVVTMLVTALYNMADTFFVGLMHNTSATGAVGVVFSFMAIIQACGYFFGQGSGNLISRLLGQGHFPEAERMASIGFFSALIAGGILLVGGLIFLDPLTRLLGATETILPYAKDYLRIILLGAPYMTASLMLNNLLRYQGNAFFSMVGIGFGAVLNVGLDPLFIFTLGWGTAGAAAATVLSQLVSFFLLLFFCGRKGNLAIRPRLFRPHLADFRGIFRCGFPTLCRQGLSSLSTVCLNRMAGLYGADAAIAAMSIATKITSLAFSAMLGFGQGFQPVCGFNFGAGLYRRVKRGYWFCVQVGTAILLLFSAVGFLFAPRLVELFSEDPEVLRLGILSLRLQWLSFPLVALLTVSNMLLQSIGLVGRASFLAMARQGILFIPLVVLLPWVLPVLFPSVEPLLGVQLAQPLADGLSFLCALPLTLFVLRGFSADKAAAPAAEKPEDAR